MAHKILVVDDSSENRFIVKTCLTAEGYSVEELSSGQDLIDLGDRVKDFDLILLDVLMPNLNGYETCRIVKDSGVASQIPIIFLSAETDENSKVSGFEAGGVDYINKPFGRKELGMRIKSHLSLSGNFKIVKRENEALAANLSAGATIQESFLPDKTFSHPKVKISWNYQPVEHIAGDMFGFLKFDDGAIGVYLLDVCGHGSSAALVASAVFGALNSNKSLMGHQTEHGYFPKSPSLVLKALSKEFPFFRFERYFTMLYSLILPDQRKVITSTAGHPAPYYLSADRNNASKIDIVGKILGLDENDNWDEVHTKFERNDNLVLLSDGVLEAKSSEGQSFDTYVATVLKGVVGNDVHELVEEVQRKLLQHIGWKKFKDDRTIVAVEFI